MYNIYYYIIAELKQCGEIMPSAFFPPELFLFILKTTWERKVQVLHPLLTEGKMEAQARIFKDSSKMAHKISGRWSPSTYSSFLPLCATLIMYTEPDLRLYAGLWETAP